jgi:hypothetical protein
MDEIEQLLEGGKAEAAALKATTAQSPSNGHKDVSSDEVSSYAALLPVYPCHADLICKFDLLRCQGKSERKR